MNNQTLQEDFEDFFENSLCGYVITNRKGDIIRCNNRLAGWLQYNKEDLKDKRFSSLLAISGKVYYETHLSPLLHLKGFFDEIELEMMTQTGGRMQCLVNGFERRDENGNPLFIRLAIFKAVERRTYEENLRNEKTAAETSLSDERQQAALREQFIAVLSHDLRNPIAGIAGCAAILMDSPTEQETVAIGQMIKKSTSRMNELVENLMDFARVRLGGGMHLNKKPVLLEPVLTHVVDELRLGYASRRVETHFSFAQHVVCDSARIAQLLSNLLANALTHGLTDDVVHVHASAAEEGFTMYVSNAGKPIAKESLATLFEPFTRECTNPNKQGLGLGLYISSEIARAHGGTLFATSDNEETRFTFHMPRLS